MNDFKRLVFIASLVGSATAASVGFAHAGDRDDKTAQAALLHDLHARFHAAASVHDAINGDSPSEISERIRDVLALWVDNPRLIIIGTTAKAGNYIGKGDPDNPQSCPPPSGDTSSTGKQGTLCTFYKYVGGSFQPANKLISLSPA